MYKTLSIVQRKDNIKYLGVYIDDVLSWKTHVQQTCAKIAKGSWALLQLRNYVNLDTLKTVYYSLVYSHLQYCISSWGSACNSTLDPLIKLHKKIVRIITKSDYIAHSTPLFAELKILKLHDIHKLELSKHMYKVSQNLYPSTHCAKFTKASAIHKHNTRSSSKGNYFIQQVNTEYGKKSIRFNGSVAWSNIPGELKKLPFGRFTKSLKQSILQSYET